ncbi:hypothetical protein [Streptomyces sp. OE57]|uniref:hypothetical protein n=1 Tax=Streptomyces lacaronensis TaxID=3379885 RepID=UPI0039B77B23
MTTTIRRNWTNRIGKIQEAAKFCRAYESSTGHMITVDPARAFDAWQANKRATLIENTPGQKWTVHIHSNRFYILTATDPEQDRQERQQTAPAPVAAPVARTSVAPAGSAKEEAVLQDVREYIQDAPGVGVRAVAAATAEVGRKVQAGRIARDRLTGALPRITAAVTAKAVADMRAQGLTHEQIRMRLERKRAEAQHDRDHGRVTVAEAMLAAHAGIVADEEQARAAEIPAQSDSGGVAQVSAAGRRAAHRLAAKERPEERPALTMPVDRALELARQSEERYRPTAAYVYVSPITRTASLRWLDAEGRDCPGVWEPVPLEGRHAHAMEEEVWNAAGLILAKRGFNCARGAYWQPYARRDAMVDAGRPEAARVAIVPTRAYLDLQARRFGPAPELPEVPGVTFKTTQRGQWWATVEDGRTFLLAWSPRLDGDRWHVWGGAQHSELVRSSTSMDKALFVLRYPAHARP